MGDPTVGEVFWVSPRDFWNGMIVPYHPNVRIIRRDGWKLTLHQQGHDDGFGVLICVLLSAQKETTWES